METLSSHNKLPTRLMPRCMDPQRFAGRLHILTLNLIGIFHVAVNLGRVSWTRRTGKKKKKKDHAKVVAPAFSLRGRQFH